MHTEVDACFSVERCSPKLVPALTGMHRQAVLTAALQNIETLG
jgi:hypothetical protein